VKRKDEKKEKRKKVEIENCTFQMLEGPVTGCTIPFEIWKVQCKISGR